MSKSAPSKDAGAKEAGSRQSHHGERASSRDNASSVAGLQGRAGNRAVHDLLHSGTGRPLDPPARSVMEARFGRSFSGVRIHTDSRAAESAEALGAKAYTVGRDVVFSNGRFAPERPEGRRLLAHELAHVVQQSRGGPASPSLDGSGPMEAAATNAADAVVSGNGPVSVAGASAPAVACEPEKPKTPPKVDTSDMPDFQLAFDPPLYAI